MLIFAIPALLSVFGYEITLLTLVASLLLTASVKDEKRRQRLDSFWQDHFFTPLPLSQTLEPKAPQGTYAMRHPIRSGITFVARGWVIMAWVAVMAIPLLQ